MLTHSIAGLKIGMDYKYPHMINQSAAYIVNEEKTDFEIVIPDEILEIAFKKNTHLTRDECEYMQTGFVFYKRLVDYNGMMLHSSAVMKNEFAYLFSAPSGTGKSTHTQQWLKAFPDAKILNDDKPAIRIEDGHVNVYGTPWSGKTALNLNVRVPLGGICFIERSENNFIDRISETDAIPKILNQTLRPRKMDNMNKLLDVIGEIVKNVPVYRMGCNISEESAIMAYEAMKA